ncbi:MAG TPA: helix-turn-helix domain-containing protein, partial [Thermomicrobiales bacterium]|nr:helix-turn-helix domain-containing protein [Thermomicrobiales bacterium]
MGEISNATFGELLRTMRENQGLTQEELAERAGLSRDAISALERGRRSRPHPATVKAINAALGVSMEEAEHLRTAAMRKIPPAAPPAPPGTHRSLPTTLTSFIGRAAELPDLMAMLTDVTVRLVTMTGPGGVGKTRLAIEVANLTRTSFPGGTSFVPLGETLDSALVMPTIAERLGVRNPAGLALPEQIALMLGNAPFLLILDN